MKWLKNLWSKVVSIFSRQSTSGQLEQTVETSTQETPKPSNQPTAYEVNLKWGKKKLPAQGRFVTESHYMTKEDWSLLGRYPKTQKEFIDNHIDYSVQLLMENGLGQGKTAKELKSAIYNNPWEREYTPSEGGGHIGGGARGPIFNNAFDEMFQGNMMFKPGHIPPIGSKFRLKFKDKSVIINMGLEVGPGQEKYLGGVVPEVHYYLGSTSDDILTIEKVDDNLRCGPE